MLVERRWKDDAMKQLYEHIMAEIERAMTPPDSARSWPPEAIQDWKRRTLDATEHMRKEAARLVDLFTTPVIFIEQK